MDAARQVVRWSIPGWILLLTLSLLQILTRLAQGRSLHDIAMSPLLHDLSTAAVALVVTSGIPLGFIIYQAYYSSYGKVLIFGLVNRDRGAEILSALPEAIRSRLLVVEDCRADLEEMYEEVRSFLLPHPFRRLRPEFRNRTGRRRYEAKVQTNWDIVRFWINYICIRQKAEAVKQEVTTMADIYHAMGAARAALLLACLLHFIYNVALTEYTWTTPWRMPVALIAPYFFALWLFRVFERTRTHALNSLQSMLKHAFLCFLPEFEQFLSARDNKERSAA